MENTECEPFRLTGTGQAKKCHEDTIDLLDGDLNGTTYMTSDEGELDEIDRATSAKYSETHHVSCPTDGGGGDLDKKNRQNEIGIGLEDVPTDTNQLLSSTDDNQEPAKHDESPVDTNTLPTTDDVIQKSVKRRLSRAQAKHHLKAWKLITTLIVLCVATIAMQSVTMYVSYYLDSLSPHWSGSGSVQESNSLPDMNIASKDPDANEKQPQSPLGTFQFKNNSDYVPPEYQFMEILMHTTFGGFF